LEYLRTRRLRIPKDFDQSVILDELVFYRLPEPFPLANELKALTAQAQPNFLDPAQKFLDETAYWTTDAAQSPVHNRDILYLHLRKAASIGMRKIWFGVIAKQFAVEIGRKYYLFQHEAPCLTNKFETAPEELQDILDYLPDILKGLGLKCKSKTVDAAGIFNIPRLTPSKYLGQKSKPHLLSLPPPPSKATLASLLLRSSSSSSSSSSSNSVYTILHVICLFFDNKIEIVFVHTVHSLYCTYLKCFSFL